MKSGISMDERTIFRCSAIVVETSVIVQWRSFRPMGTRSVKHSILYSRAWLNRQDRCLANDRFYSCATCRRDFVHRSSTSLRLSKHRINCCRHVNCSRFPSLSRNSIPKVIVVSRVNGTLGRRSIPHRSRSDRARTGDRRDETVRKDALLDVHTRCDGLRQGTSPRYPMIVPNTLRHRRL
jgi:hypothetical protein